jgi:hypothetical protein
VFIIGLSVADLKLSFQTLRTFMLVAMTQLLTDHPARHPNQTAKANSLAYLVFERTDLDEAERFLVDFGLVVVGRTDEVLCLRGTSGAPYCYRVCRTEKSHFVGLGFTVGAALSVPSSGEQKVAALLPERKKWAIFLKAQSTRSQYLKVGDVVEASIRSSEGDMDLGVQRNRIVAER